MEKAFNLERTVAARLNGAARVPGSSYIGSSNKQKEKYEQEHQRR
jgi:hypothetical protein